VSDTKAPARPGPSSSREAPPPLTGVPERPFPRLLAMTGGVVAFAVVWSLIQVDADWRELLDGPQNAWRILQLMIEEVTWVDFTRSLHAMWDSIAMAWLGTLLAAVVAVPLSFLAAENLVPNWFSFVMRQVFNVLRAIPEIVLAVALIPAFGLTKTAGVMAIAIGSIGTLSKLCSEIIEGIDPGPVEAADAVGARPTQRLRWSVAPQVLPEITSFLLYRFEINIRVSAILGVVGAGGIGSLLYQGFYFKQWGVAGAALAVTIGITMVVDLISGWVRHRILAGPPGDRATEGVGPAADADGVIVLDGMGG
jgi:phosphonate transport system permease protein